MKGIIWLLSGFNKREWLDKNLDILVPLLDERKDDLLFIVSNGIDIADIKIKYNNSRIYTSNFSYNRGEPSSPHQMDYGAYDLFNHCEYFANAYDSDKISHIVCAHWDVILYNTNYIINLFKQLEDENKDLACYYRKINFDLNEDICPHGILFIKKEIITEEKLWSTLPLFEEKGWGIERALFHWFLRKYDSDRLFPEHSKIINLGLTDYCSKEKTHIHTHNYNEMMEMLNGNQSN